MNLQPMTRLELEALHAVTLKHIDSVEHNNADEGASVDTFERQHHPEINMASTECRHWV
jgi:hypothetical protein